MFARAWLVFLDQTTLDRSPSSRFTPVQHEEPDFQTSPAPSGAEQNWRQWRGPLATGVAPAANPALTWSESDNIKWKVQIPGSGRATPIVWGNQVFIQTAIPTTKKVEPPKVQLPAENLRIPAVVGLLADPPPEPRPERRRPGGGGPGGGGGFGGRGAKPTEIHQFALLCLDRQTGKTLWQKTACEELPHEGHHPDGSFSSYSPVTDGQHVFAYFGSRGLYCYDMAGRLQWSQNFGQQHIAMGFGEGSSPALHGDTLIVNWDNEGDSFIIALDKTTGKTRWKQPRDERTSWATPLVVEYEGKAQVVTAATRKIRSYDLASGKLIWECGGLTPNVIPTPVAGDGMVYPTSGFRG